MQAEEVPVVGQIENRRTLFRIAQETQLILEKLRETADEISYDELSAAAGIDVRNEGYANLRSACKIMQRDDRVVWGVKRGVGLVRLRDGEIVASGAATRSRIHEAAKRGRDRLECADYSRLSHYQQVQFNAEAAIQSALGALSSPKSYARIERRTSDHARKLDIRETLELFGSS